MNHTLYHELHELQRTSRLHKKCLLPVGHPSRYFGRSLQNFSTNQVVLGSESEKLAEMVVGMVPLKVRGIVAALAYV